MAKWNCVICGTKNRSNQLDREGMLCSDCGSNWRVRATALGVLIGTSSAIRPIPDIPKNYFWRGIGTSDHMALVGALATRFDYTNSYYHRFPKVDLLNVTEELHGQFGFVICSDVLEHVPPPADRALAGIRRLLAGHGFAVLSVPVASKTAPTDEYYPSLHSWSENEGLVTWKNESGDVFTDPEPEYHGGVGQTLAFRTWGGDDFVNRLLAVGMSAVNEIPECAELGVPKIDNHGVYLAYPNPSGPPL